MKGLSVLAEEMIGLVEGATEVHKGNLVDLATKFIKTRETVDGDKWSRDTEPRFGFNSAPRVTRENKKETKDGELVYSARVRFAPGGSGGAGVGMDPTSSNYLYTMLGADKRAADAIVKALHKEVVSMNRKLAESLRKWFSKPENFMHHIVGYGNKDNYNVKDVVLKDLKYESGLIDPTRRKWPASRVEAWVPVTADVIITVKRK